MNIEGNFPIKPETQPMLADVIPLEILTELGQATTVYHEAGPDRLENARQAYEAALERFRSWRPGRST